MPFTSTVAPILGSRIGRRPRAALLVLLGLLVSGVPAAAHISTAAAAVPPGGSGDRTATRHTVTREAATVTLLATGLAGATGSGTTIGPDGAVYVTEGQIGRISRVDPSTGKVSTFADGLPTPLIPIGGVMDVAFLGRTAYAIVTNVGPDLGGTHVVGLYRITGPHTWTVVADIGTWSITHPSKSEVFIPSGVLYAMQPYRDGFLVSDGHHNRVLQVGLNGQVSEILALPDVVPTGLEIHAGRVYTALAGPVPHLPDAGQAITYTTQHAQPVVVASGAPLLVDIEFGRHDTLYGLAQGHFTPGQGAGASADPHTGMLMRADHGTFVPIAQGLDRPTSFEITGDTAYIATLSGQVWKVNHIQ